MTVARMHQVATTDPVVVVRHRSCQELCVTGLYPKLLPRPPLACFKSSWVTS